MLCWPILAVVRMDVVTLFGTLGGPQYDCLSQKWEFITQSVGGKRMKNYQSLHMTLHLRTTQCHQRLA